jgi:hypothetical protein
MNQAELASKALGELRARGHCKDGYFGADGTVCLGGAFLAALGVGREYEDLPIDDDQVLFTNELRETGERLLRIIRELYPDRPMAGVISRYTWGAIYGFNDHAATTQEDAELVLKHLAGETRLWRTGPPPAGRPGRGGKSSAPPSPG